MQPLGLLVGLGNPGREYDHTRHNFGFMVVDALSGDLPDAYSPTWGSAASVKAVARRSQLSRIELPQGPLFLLKPLTFMNLSGEATVPTLAWYKFPPDKLLVVHDELDLPLGRMRLKFGGGLAGHNGLKSIAGLLGTQDFYRLRLGVGKPVRGDASGFVLARFAKHEQDCVNQTLAAACRTVELFHADGFAKAQEFAAKFAPDAA